MLEIAIIYILSKNISGRVKSKGYKAVWFVLIFIGLWFAGEFLGAITGVVVGIVTNSASAGGIGARNVH